MRKCPDAALCNPFNALSEPDLRAEFVAPWFHTPKAKKSTLFVKKSVAILYILFIITFVLLHGISGDWATPKRPTAGLFYALAGGELFSATSTRSSARQARSVRAAKAKAQAHCAVLSHKYNR